MRSIVKIGGIGLVVLSMSLLISNVQAANKASSEEQVAVLMKMYWTYFEQGKYKQAEQVAQLASELAPKESGDRRSAQARSTATSQCGCQRRGSGSIDSGYSEAGSCGTSATRH